MDIVKKDIGGNAEAEVVLYQPDSSIHIEVLVEGGDCVAYYPTNGSVI